MVHFLNYSYCTFIRQWSMPFCAFFSTFTIVMTLLILSTDLKAGRRFMRFNASYLWDFEGIPQESPYLSVLIREKYFLSPVAHQETNSLSKKPSIEIFSLFRKKRAGSFIECGSNGKGDTEWLEKTLGWEGLLTQPKPDEFEKLKAMKRSKSHLAQVCISPTVYPKHAYFKFNATYNESLQAIPCFPLYSLMRAYNATHLDLLSFKDITAPVQVLKTLPVGKVRIKVIMIRNGDAEEEDFEDVCCNKELVSLLEKWGYKSKFSCDEVKPECYFVCATTYCPLPVKS